MKKFVFKICIFCLGLTTLLYGMAFAEPQSTPNGPWVEDEQNLSLQGIMTNEELYKKLEQIEHASKGRMELEIVGYSDAIYGDLMEPLGYPLYLCKFGDPDPNSDNFRVLITSQIHGGEVLGTQALVKLMQKFSGGGKEANKILENVTLWLMPRVNPEGAMSERDGQWYPTRRNHQIWDPAFFGLPEDTSSPWYYRSSSEGYDLNRDSNPNLNFRIEDLAYYGWTLEEFAEDILDNRDMNNSSYGGYYVNPEARIITEVYQRLEPDVYIDVHHRGFNYLSEEDIRSVSIQVAAEVADPYTDPFSGDHYEVDADVLELAKQVNVVGYQALQRGFSHYGAIQRYPTVNLPGTTLGTFALNDSAIMLIEIKGQTQNIGQKQSGMLTQTAVVSIYEILIALADGTIHDVDAALYEDILPSANRMRDPSQRDEEW
jgi:Zinc carboxypeptidase